MGMIAVEGMEFHAYHGVYDEEQVIGNTYIIDVYIQSSVVDHVADDDIVETINYETVFLICQTEMKKKFKLLESISVRIIDALKHQFDSIQEVSIKVQKNNPFPGFKVASASIETSDSFLSQCPRCKSGNLCYKDGNCWCNKQQLFSTTREALKSQFKGCLCEDCLQYYAGRR